MGVEQHLDENTKVYQEKNWHSVPDTALLDTIKLISLEMYTAPENKQGSKLGLTKKFGSTKESFSKLWKIKKISIAWKKVAPKLESHEGWNL